MFVSKKSLIIKDKSNSTFDSNGIEIEEPDGDHISTSNCSRANLLVLVFQKLDQQMRSPYAKMYKSAG